MPGTVLFSTSFKAIQREKKEINTNKKICLSIVFTITMSCKKEIIAKNVLRMNFLKTLFNTIQQKPFDDGGRRADSTTDKTFRYQQ